jgi:hypothetical protein
VRDRGSCRRLVLLALALALPPLLAACPQPETFDTRIEILVDPEQDPLADAATLRVRVRYPDGDVLEDELEAGSGERALSGLHEAAGVVVELEALDSSGAVVALGRSFAFDIGVSGADAAVFVGRADSIARLPAPLASARTFARAVAVPGDRLLVVGGGDNDDDSIDAVERLGRSAEEPVATDELGELDRIGHTLAYVPENEGDWGGKAVVIGGTVGTGVDTLEGGWDSAVDSVSLIDPDTGEIEEDAAPLSFGYLDSRCATMPDGRIAVVGGYYPSGAQVPYNDRVRILDPDDGSEEDGPTLPTREQFALGTLDVGGMPAILIAGGLLFQGGADGAQELVSASLWSGDVDDDPIAVGPLNVGRGRHQVTALGQGRALVSGGAFELTDVLETGTSLDSAELFDAVAQQFTLLPAAMTSPRQRHVAVAIPDERVLICAGQGVGGMPLSSCEIYDEATETFLPYSGTLQPGGPGVAAVPFDDGRILFVGGASGLGPGDSIHVYFPPEWGD